MGLCCWLNWLNTPLAWALVGLIVLPIVARALKVPAGIAGKVVLVTGGSEGIGKSIAEDCARRGAHVVLLARTASKLEAAVAEVKKHAAGADQKFGYVTADVTKLDAVEAAVAEVVANYGVPDVLVTSAGAAQPGYFLDQAASTFEWTMQVNYMGNVNVLKTVAPLMVSRGEGKVMIVASALAVTSFIGYASYAPTKHALRGLADTLRNELCGFGVQVSICYPPDTDTPGFKRENEMKPKETLKCFPVDAYAPEVVAATSMSSFLKGDYHIQSADVLQNLLVSSMTGVTPRSLWFVETLAQPLLCVVQAPFVWWFDYQARQYAARVRSEKLVDKKTN